MSAFDRDTVVYNDEFKTYNGFKYHLGFPDDWILDELPETGRECWNCVGRPNNGKGYAMWRGIILGYCVNCAEKYNGKRCTGFYAHGVEMQQNNYESAYDKYLGKIDFENYGDLEANPKDTMKNQKLFNGEQEPFDDKEECEDSEYEDPDYPQSEIDAQERACAAYTDEDYERDCKALEEEALNEWSENLQRYPCYECDICDGCKQCQAKWHDECEYSDTSEDEFDDDYDDECCAQGCKNLCIGKTYYCKKHQESVGKRVR
jgi:hypothetical protein